MSRAVNQERSAARSIPPQCRAGCYPAEVPDLRLPPSAGRMTAAEQLALRADVGMTAPSYFLMRLVRNGPLVPARLMYLDHGPDDPPDNKLDRWPPIYPFADIAGDVRPPEDLMERFHVAPSHWKYAQPITEAEYRRAFDRMRWAERHRPTDPTLRPRRAVDPAQVPLPNFNRENAR